MAKKSAGLREIPPLIKEYFGLSSYKDCEAWTLKEWTTAARLRRSRYHLVDDAHKDRWRGNTRLLPFASLLDDYIKDPLADQEWSRPIPRSGLRELTLGHVDTFVQDIIASKIPLHPNRLLTDLVQRIYGSRSAFIEVDLSMNDQLLMEKFKSWIEDARSNLHIQPPKDVLANLINEGDFFRWHHTWKLLPYIDLVSWNRVNDSPLNDATIKELLELDDLRTTKEKALTFLSAESVAAMEKQLEWLF